ncbi:sugar lactone lactonase YvrE [Kibdelosporangium banguiense]|uniref:Sugar lactone lactonase YvrE n=1 Tax=Kibdelosporangium banguiense TaxID=1365924 RepID=A0ABS4T8K1_9PSEU|nr:SMP-30/gluconolactonase/LRE family protein [Kibdelosporangium banguiense]MBP2320153.1 sugar lactone lactonase YvrE [Kibdelosporangium banguiense]
MTLDIAVQATASLGEGPTWDARSGTLIWVDILAPEIHRWNPSTGVNETSTAPQHVGAAKPRAGGGLVVNLRDGVAIVDSAGEYRWLVYWARDNVRGNDAGVDAAGRLWAGTMRYDTADGGGWLARVEPDGKASMVLEKVTISNGVGWSPDNTRMYFADTPTGLIDVFDYDLATGAVTSRRHLVDVAGSPDGLCVDADGCIWVALWGEGQVRRYTPDGKLDRTITVPASLTTACCFGGANLADLYITTARVGLTDEELEQQPLAGSVFVVPDVGTGMPSTVFAG